MSLSTGSAAVAGSAPQPNAWPLLGAARSEEALERATDALAAHLASHPELPLSDVAFTLQTGRRGFAHRRALVCRPGEDAAGLLRRRDPERVLTRLAEATDRTAPVAGPDALDPHALAQLWLSGRRPDWRAFHAGERRRRVPLPTYPFERRRYWLDAPGVPRPLGALADE
jgi:polyketide synthase PksN